MPLRLCGGGIFFAKNPKFRLFLSSFLPRGMRFFDHAEGGMEILLTAKELAAALKLTEQTVQRYVLRKEIPFRKIMRAVRFRPSEINRWIDGGGLLGETEGARLEASEIGGEI
jgi:excisionase family DNA binding protein